MAARSSIRTNHLAARFELWQKSESNFSSIPARTHKNSMLSDADANDDCNCNVVVTEQPHCIVGHPNVLDSGDAMEETTISSVQDP